MCVHIYIYVCARDGKVDEAVKGDGKNMERLEENRLGGFSASRRNEGWNGIVRRLFAYYGMLGIGRNSQAIERAASIRGNR